jgi:hypothetical protein
MSSKDQRDDASWLAMVGQAPVTAINPRRRKPHVQGEEYAFKSIGSVPAHVIDTKHGK